MKKKWMQKAVAAALMASLLAGQALPAAAADAARVDTETLKIATLSDTHYLSPDMIKNTEDFTEHLNSDRKMFAESDAFLRALLDTVKKARRILLNAWYTGSRPAARNRIRMV